MNNSDIYYEFDYIDDDIDYRTINGINIIQKTENSLFSFEIKLSENKDIIDELKIFINKIKSGCNNVRLYIIYNKFNTQQIYYNDNKYNFIADFVGQSDGFYTVKFISELNLLNMFENMINEYAEKKNKYIINDEYIINNEKKKHQEYLDFCNYFGSYKL
jgi:hypothetical protein